MAENLHEDTAIVTAGCTKYRYNKLALGDIGGILEGELMIVVGLVPKQCSNCQAPIKDEAFKFCPVCGAAC